MAQVDPTLLLLVRESPAILKLLSGKYKSLLIRRDALLVLDLRLDIVNRIRGLHLEGDGLAGQGLDEAVGWLGSVTSHAEGLVLNGAKRGDGR